MKIIPESAVDHAFKQTDKPHHTCNNIRCSYFSRTGWPKGQASPSGGCGHFSGEPCDAKKYSKYNPSQPIIQDIRRT